MLLRGRFLGLSPLRGDMLLRMGEIWHGGVDRRSPSFIGPLLRAKLLSTDPCQILAIGATISVL